MSAELTQLLDRLQGADGLDLVAVVTMDGLLIDAASKSEVDQAGLAAVACNGLLMARAMGGEMGRGEPIQAIIEFQGGLLLLTPLDEDLGLVMLGPKDANLGRLRLVARKYGPDILKATSI